MWQYLADSKALVPLCDIGHLNKNTNSCLCYILSMVKALLLAGADTFLDAQNVSKHKSTTPSC